MAFMEVAKKTGRALAVTAAIVAAVSFTAAPSTAYAQRGHGGGGGWDGGGGRGDGGGRGAGAAAGVAAAGVAPGSDSAFSPAQRSPTLITATRTRTAMGTRTVIMA